MDTGKIFLQSAIKRLKYYKELGDKTIGQLNEHQLHYQPNPASNSIALIIQRMAGNMLSRWTDFLHSDGEKDWRNRDIEFEDMHLSREALIEKWEKGWECLFHALEGLTTDDLQKTIRIRSEELDVIDAINRQLAHYPYHVGQMIFLGKLLLDGEWENLSIPKGASDAFNMQMKKNN